MEIHSLCTVNCKAVSKQNIKQNKPITVVDAIQQNEIKTKQLLFVMTSDGVVLRDNALKLL